MLKFYILLLFNIKSAFCMTKFMCEENSSLDKLEKIPNGKFCRDSFIVILLKDVSHLVYTNHFVIITQD